jgi:c-di-GMP-binding flagellar brake protein YcgR
VISKAARKPRGAVTSEKSARLDPRIPVRVRVDIQYPPGAATWTRADSLDLSASGGYVRCDLALPLKAQVGCRVHLPPAGGQEDRLIDCDAVVVRVDAPEPGTKEWRYGLYFLGIAEGDRQAIRRFVFASL